jgi:glycerate dehydrogenase
MRATGSAASQGRTVISKHSKTPNGSHPLQIVFLDRITLPDTVHVRDPVFAHQWQSHLSSEPSDVQDRVAHADIVITNKVHIGRSAIAAAPRLKLIAVAATGTDIIDLAAARDGGVIVSNIRNYAAHTVPEHTFALMLALRRNIVAYHRSVGTGRWQEAGQFCYFDYSIRDLAATNLGIIGDGVLGRAVADVARAFGMKVLFSDYKGTSGMGPLYTPFTEVLRTADIITLHSPLNPSTRNMIAAPEFAEMRRKPLLINTARGGLVDEAALADALERGLISGAAFDVVTQEPPPSHHPFMRLINRPDFILTPHVAWASHEAIQGLADQLIDNVEAFVAGSPRNVVE